MVQGGLISVIVPVYKTQQYLDRCVQSIVDQTYQNLEIILVDDGSPDNCGVMCDAWAAEDSRIKVIHKDNGGLSDARNAGLDAATGEYIAFVDSDDWVHQCYIERLVLTAKENNAQIAACDVLFVSDQSEAVISGTGVTKKYTPGQAMETLITGTVFRAVAWNKLYHKSVICEERFPVGRNHEDEFFTYRVIDKAEKLAYIDSTLYYYYQRAGSIMNSYSIKRLDALDAYLERIALLREKYPHLYLRDKVTFCVSCVMFYQAANTRADVDLRKIRKKIRFCRKQISFSVSEYLGLSMKDQLYVLGSGVLLRPFCCLLRMRRG